MEVITSRAKGVVDESPLVADKAFNNHDKNDGHHVSPFDNHTIQVGRDGIEVVLAQGLDEDAFKRTLSAATRATIGIDIAGRWERCGNIEPDDPDDEPEPDSHSKHEWRDSHWWGLVDPLEPEQDWKEMLKGGLQTALETQVIVFAVRGVSRTCTHQLVRSRRASFHQQSQRASYMGDAPEFRMPESVWKNPTIRDSWIQAVRVAWEAYRMAAVAGVSYQDARFILPEGTTGFILCEYPLREFLNVYAYRACSMFQWEIVEVFRQMREVLIHAHPWLEPHVKISCEKTKGALDAGAWQEGTPAVAHHCTFQGWEQVDEQCDFPWARETNRSFRSERHGIG